MMLWAFYIMNLTGALAKATMYHHTKNWSKRSSTNPDTSKSSVFASGPIVSTVCFESNSFHKYHSSIYSWMGQRHCFETQEQIREPPCSKQTNHPKGMQASTGLSDLWPDPKLRESKSSILCFNEDTGKYHSAAKTKLLPTANWAWPNIQVSEWLLWHLVKHWIQAPKMWALKVKNACFLSPLVIVANFLSLFKSSGNIMFIVFLHKFTGSNSYFWIQRMALYLSLSLHQ